MRFFILLLFWFYSCAQESMIVQKYPEQVGNIEYDPKLDKANFKTCLKEKYLFQYYNLENGFQYKGGYFELHKEIKENFRYVNNTEYESGYIVIRFLVNCQGETDRFRVQEIGLDYQPKKFNKELVNQLLTITKNLKGWNAGEFKGYKVDYYQYLTFVIGNGKIKAIKP